jgi:hypothetical protein
MTPQGRDQSRAALVVAKAAASFVHDGSKGLETLGLAFSLGANPTFCAHLFSSMGCAELLDACIRRGADILSPLFKLDHFSHEPLGMSSHDIDDTGKTGHEATPLARALFSGSASCCALLVARGADLLLDPTCAEVLTQLRDDGVARWQAIMAGLASSKPDPTQAQALSGPMLLFAAESFHNRKDALGETHAALDALERLATLGADYSKAFDHPADRAWALGHSCGSGLFARAMQAFSYAQRRVNLSEAIGALASFALARDPQGSGANLGEAISFYAKTAGGAGSALPEPEVAESLRSACLLLSKHCNPPLVLMQSIMDDLREKKALRPDHAHGHSKPPTNIKASRKSLMFLLKTKNEWVPLPDESVAHATELMVECLKASAIYWAHAPASLADPKANPSQWLSWALLDEPPAQIERQGAAWPLMAAKLAAASDLRLADAFVRIAKSASALALPGLDEDMRSALALALDLAAHAALPHPETLSDSPLRI